MRGGVYRRVRVRKAFKSFLVLLAAVILVSVAAFAWVRFAPRRVPAGQSPLAVLDEAGSLAAFRDAFNAGSEQVRVLVMLSPT